MAFTVNTIKPDISNLLIYLRGAPKWGKSTLFRDVALIKGNYDPTSACIIETGCENATTMLDGIIVQKAPTWTDFVETVDQLVDRENITEAKNIKMVSIDTLDQLVNMAETQAIDDGNLEARRKHARSKNSTGFKPVISILEAFGGYGAGKKYAVDKLIIPQIKRLLDSGLGVWIVGHSKFKTSGKQTDEGDFKYEVMTSNLESTYENSLSGIADVILTAAFHYDKDDYEQETRKGFGSTQEIRTAKNFGKQRIYFRSTPTIEAGGRFKNGSVPTYLEFEHYEVDAEKFVKVFEEGLRLSSIENRKELLEKIKADKAREHEELEQLKTAASNETVSDSVDEVAEQEEIALEVVDDSKERLDLAKKVGEAFQAEKNQSKKEQVKEILAEYKTLSKCPMDALLEMKEVLGIRG